MQVQAALADSSKLSHLAVPAQQAAQQQHEGLAQSTGAVPSSVQGLHATASAASWQHPAGALMPPAISQGGEGSTPAGDNYSTILHFASVSCTHMLTSAIDQVRQLDAYMCVYA